MRNRQPLPAPSLTALQHSEQLRQLITKVIQQTGGSIPFKQFMQMALYQPGFGYYVAGQEKFGTNGDFVTAPEISSLFSHCVANHCATVFTGLKANNNENLNEDMSILELGAGSGIMAADILLYLATIDALPRSYLILEPGTELRQRQRETLQQRCPQLLERVQWLQVLPQKPMRGIILANEVMDAMPVELFYIPGTEVEITETKKPETYCIHVTEQQGKLRFKAIPSTVGQTTQIRHNCLDTWDQYYNAYRPNQSYQSEYNPALSGWLKSLSSTLGQGEILLIDYGYERKDYYRPERDQGTLLCHYRHRVHDQPLLWPGLQDVTCSVDFTAVAEAADNASLKVAAYQTQADFLFSVGLETLFNTELGKYPEKQYQLAQQVRTLTLPAEMGERFKVMTLTKGFTSASQHNTLSALHFSDRRNRL